MFDLFGLKKEIDARSDADSRPGSTPGPTLAGKRFWAVLLLLDTVLVFVFAGALTGMLWLRRSRIQPPVPASAAAKKAPPKAIAGPQPARTAEPKVPPPEAPTAPKEPEAPPAKGPIGSPAVSAPELPQRQAQPAATTKETDGSKPKARPVEFTCRAKDAREVLLRGPFLVRTGGLKLMIKGSDEAWHATVSLLPGTYKYSCVVDGKRRKGGTVEVP